MGQKIHPTAHRLGYIKTWKSRWYAEENYSELLKEDIKLREYIKERFSHAGIADIVIERAAQKLKIAVHTSRPGVVIGKKGSEVDKLKDEIEKMTGKEIFINIQEINKPELNAKLVAENIGRQLKRQVSFRRVMKRAIDSALQFGAEGIKIRVAGRLGGAEIARSEWYREGSLPLHTYRADIDYGLYEAETTYGIIGVKVWINKGEILDPDIDDMRL